MKKFISKFAVGAALKVIVALPAPANTVHVVAVPSMAALAGVSWMMLFAVINEFVSVKASPLVSLRNLPAGASMVAPSPAVVLIPLVMFKPVVGFTLNSIVGALPSSSETSNCAVVPLPDNKNFVPS